MRACLAGCIVLLLLSPVSLDGWGLDVHRTITRRALTGLPAGLRPFFASRSAFIEEHSVDPDLWRVVGLKGERGDEDPNHFLDIDGLDEPRPFKNVPRDWDAYVARYGAERANRMGRLPWRVDEVYQLLVARFRDVAKASPGYAAENVAYLSAVIAHYVEDAHVPFHAVVNYDGQATNQRGIHSRFESELVMRNLARLKLAPVRLRPIPNVKEFVFETLASGEPLVEAILEADRAAIGGREFYDDAYFATFLRGARPVMEQRLADAAGAVASVITAAWTEAGKPAMPVSRTTTPASIRR
jgi:alkylated DNA nucleotide flippase Atl1